MDKICNNSISTNWLHVYKQVEQRNEVMNPIYVWFNDWFPGGGEITPPLFFFIWYVFRKPLGSTSVICKKIGKFAKNQTFIAKSSN